MIKYTKEIIKKKKKKKTQNRLKDLSTIKKKKYKDDNKCELFKTKDLNQRLKQEGSKSVFNLKL